MARTRSNRKATARRKSAGRADPYDADYTPISSPSTPKPFLAKPRVYKPSTDPTYRLPRQPSTPSSVGSPEALRDAAKYLRRPPMSKVSKPSQKGKTRHTKMSANKEAVSNGGSVPQIGPTPARVLTGTSSGERTGQLRPRLEGHDDTTILSKEAVSVAANGGQPVHTPRFSPKAKRTELPAASSIIKPSFKAAKRQLDEEPDMPPPKKFCFMRNSGPADNLHQPTWAEMKASSSLPVKLAEKLLADMEARPVELSLAEVSALFHHLQDQIQAFAEKNFNFDLTEAVQQAWPLHELSTIYRPLMLMTQYIADGSQYSWRGFFTRREHRVPLVYGIIGEWLKHRVFNHTAFSLSTSELDELEDIDREYIHYDAFVRNKARAKLLRHMLYNRNKDTFARRAALQSASETLADELLTLLTPLLPPSTFKFCSSLRAFSPLPEDHAPNTAHSVLRTDLTQLIKSAAGLHLSIRLTGANGTLIRIAPAIPKGSIFHPTAPMHCINGAFCNATRDEHPGSELRIKMTCFGRVEAVVPHGPDADELLKAQEQYVGLLGEEKGDRFDWADVEDAVWPMLPQDLQDEEGQNVGTEVTDEGKQKPKTKTEPKLKRGAYVTVYPRLCESVVYCEWTPKETAKAEAPEEQNLSLREAIQQARNLHANAVRYKLTDASITAWNGFVRHETTAEWAILAALLAAGGWKVSKRLLLSDERLQLFTRLLGNVRGVVSARLQRLLSAMPLAQIEHLIAMAKDWALGISRDTEQVFHMLAPRIPSLDAIPTSAADAKISSEQDLRG